MIYFNGSELVSVLSLDSRNASGMGRFVRQRHLYNAIPRVVNVHGKKKVLIYAARQMSKGQEVVLHPGILTAPSEVS